METTSNKYLVKHYIQGFKWKKGDTFASADYNDLRMLKYYLRTGQIEEIKDIPKEKELLPTEVTKTTETPSLVKEKHNKKSSSKDVSDSVVTSEQK